MHLRYTSLPADFSAAAFRNRDPSAGLLFVSSGSTYCSWAKRAGRVRECYGIIIYAWKTCHDACAVQQEEMRTTGLAILHGMPDAAE